MAEDYNMSQILSQGMGGTPPLVVVETLTGNTGGAVGPTANNINVPGGSNMNTVGDPGTSTLTINLNEYIVWPDTNDTGTSGVIYLGTDINNNPIPFMGNYTGSSSPEYEQNNVFLGGDAGNFTNNSVEGGNTGIGWVVLRNLTSGIHNTGVGNSSLTSITTDSYNTAVGDGSLQFITAGTTYNTGMGYLCMQNMTGGSNNTALGFYPISGCGSNYTGSESNNILINHPGVLGESNVMHIGVSGSGASEIDTTYIAGIYGSTVNAGTGTAVYIDSTGLMGTVVSSKRFKKNIESLNHESEALYSLRAVSFNRIGDSDNTDQKQFGLIAEEVEEVFPELVIYQKGEPFSVKYNDLPVLLLHELQKQQSLIQSLIKRINILEEELGDFDEL
jgi:hypothetical protein